MSELFQYEINLEKEMISHFSKNGIKAFRSTDTELLAQDNVQVSIEYGGSLEDARQLRQTSHEYDLHEATANIVVTTYRDSIDKHYKLVAKIRSLMINSNNPFKGGYYYVFDIKPEASSTIEDQETNADQTTLDYTIKWKINFSKL